MTDSVVLIQKAVNQWGGEKVDFMKLFVSALFLQTEMLENK